MKNTRNEFKSIREIKDKYFPKDVEREEHTNDYREMGINLSQNTLNKIKTEISKL
ncbi:MAG: hypothetical protein GY777_24335 [Candidatus Brocadiaceae bacterium]|nr:hypothetical protein [Candidatus Brocadiaceae bacterium]